MVLLLLTFFKIANKKKKKIEQTTMLRFFHLQILTLLVIFKTRTLYTDVNLRNE